MPRPIGSVKPTPKYCHHKATGRAYVTLSGREIYLGAHGSPESYAAYDRALAEWLAAGRRCNAATSTAAAISSSGLTVTMLLAAFWEHARREYNPPPFAPGQRPKGELGNYWDVIKPLRRLYGATPAAAFGPLALQALREECVKLGWSRTYLNRNVSRVKAIFRWGVAQQILPASLHHALDAVDGIRKGRANVRESEPVKPVTPATIAATLSHLSPTLRAMIELQMISGMRPGEVCAMRGREIDRSGRTWVYRPTAHKTAHHGHVREVFLGRLCQELLAPFLKSDPDAYLFSPAEAEAARRAGQRAARATQLTPSQLARQLRARRRLRRRAPRDRYTSESYRRAVARAADRADRWAHGARVAGDDERLVPHWHPHQIRHTAATRWRRDHGADATLTLLGDRTSRMLDIYAEQDRAKAEQIMAAVG